MKRIREHFLPIQNDRVARGRITSWKVYQLAFPNGDLPEYNFIVIHELPSFAHLEGGPADAAMARKVVGTEKYDQVTANPLAKFMRTETLVLRLTTSSWLSATNRYLSLSFLRSLPGKNEDLMELQRNHYLPSTEDAVAEGRMTSWGHAVLRFPEQREYLYTHLSIAGYASLTQMEKEPSAAQHEKWDAKAAAAVTKLPTVRNRVKGELWRLVEQTTLARPGT